MIPKDEPNAEENGATLNRRNFIASALAAGLAVTSHPIEALAAEKNQAGAAEKIVHRGIRLPRPPLRVGFTHVFTPLRRDDKTWYLNDHCFIQDASGTWHLFGITGMEPAIPGHERFLLHATAKNLLGPWTEHATVMQVDSAAGETVVWAPYVLKHDGRYWMFYCGGGPRDEKYRIDLATSPDLWTWTRSSANPLVVDGYDARDPMVLRVGAQWVLYYCATERPEGGHHVVKSVTSTDLIHWSDRRVVFRSPVTGTYGGPTESPYVVVRNSKYYLFVCTNSPYNNTDVYVSDSPFHWSPKDVVLRYGAHASEVVDAGDGRWFTSSAGWGQGGLYLSSLTWAD